MEGGKSVWRLFDLSCLRGEREKGRRFNSVLLFLGTSSFPQIMEEIHSMTSKDKLSPVPVLGFSAMIERAEVGFKLLTSGPGSRNSVFDIT